MRRGPLLISAVFATAIGTAAIAAIAAPAGSPCGQIAAACRSAGFVPQAPVFAQPDAPRFAQRDAPGRARSAAPAGADRFSTPNAPPAATEQSQSFAQNPSSTQSPSSQPVPDGARRPNIIFILTDDLSSNLLQFMPRVQEMQKKGVTFANFFVSNSLCCPSRATIFTGRYPHNTGVLTNFGDNGGYQTFQRRGHEQATFATALTKAGYRTAMLGKYLNRYRPEKGDPVAPGWTTWAVAGNAYRGFNYTLNQDGKLVRYGNKPTDYITDVLSDLAVRFIKQSGQTPFMIEVSTFAPHRPYTPAPRDADAFPGLRAPRSPAFGAAPDANAVQWVRALPPLAGRDMARIDREFRMRAQSVQAIDKMIGDLQAAVAAIGQENNTYFFFSSDNGYHMGEHRLLSGKRTAYDTDIRVPLIVTGPGVLAGVTVKEIAQNTDFFPTFVELGKGTIPANVDGRSLARLLHGQQIADWRTMAFIDHYESAARNRKDPDSDSTEVDDDRQGRRRLRERMPGADMKAKRHGYPPAYQAIRTPQWVYVEYATGEKQYHDLTSDPHELLNSFSSLPDGRKATLRATLEAVKKCQGAMNCGAAERPLRSMQ